MLCYIVLDQPPLTRAERVKNVKKRDYFTQYGERARKVLESLLDKYADEGIENIEDMKILQINPLAQFGSPLEIINLSWQNISLLGKNKFINSFSYWFLLVPFLAKFAKNVSINLPFNLKVFFVCSLFFGVSNILYKFFCPEIIKLYKNPQDFLSKGGNVFQINNVIENSELSENTLPSCAKDDELKAKFSSLVVLLNSQRPFVRCTISLVYFFGIILFAIVIYMNICTVFGFECNNLLGFL